MTSVPFEKILEAILPVNACKGWKGSPLRYENVICFHVDVDAVVFGLANNNDRLGI